MVWCGAARGGPDSRVEPDGVACASLEVSMVAMALGVDMLSTWWSATRVLDLHGLHGLAVPWRRSHGPYEHSIASVARNMP